MVPSRDLGSTSSERSSFDRGWQRRASSREESEQLLGLKDRARIADPPPEAQGAPKHGAGIGEPPLCDQRLAEQVMRLGHSPEEAAVACRGEFNRPASGLFRRGRILNGQ